VLPSSIALAMGYGIITSVFRRLFSIKAIAYLLSNILVIKLFAVFFQDLLSISLNHILLLE
ncbi:hypothetical protein, partial [Serratia marcescens]|uniref:hypothetical protein n=1 Tax=Serratia marcescens TaxID=615 RepID=UPI0019546327